LRLTNKVIARTFRRQLVLFHNVTEQPIVFSVACTGTAPNEFTVARGGDEHIYCSNSAQSAQVIIRTNHRSYDEVVQAVVWDGPGYEHGYDDDGDVNIESL
jgi:hypothetical protein